jgi:hypothetical protein
MAPSHRTDPGVRAKHSKSFQYTKDGLRTHRAPLRMAPHTHDTCQRHSEWTQNKSGALNTSFRILNMHDHRSVDALNTRTPGLTLRIHGIGDTYAGSSERTLFECACSVHTTMRTHEHHPRT